MNVNELTSEAIRAATHGISDQVTNKQTAVSQGAFEFSFFPHSTFIC